MVCVLIIVCSNSFEITALQMNVEIIYRVCQLPFIILNDFWLFYLSNPDISYIFRYFDFTYVTFGFCGGNPRHERTAS